MAYKEEISKIATSLLVDEMERTAGVADIAKNTANFVKDGFKGQGVKDAIQGAKNIKNGVKGGATQMAKGIGQTAATYGTIATGAGLAAKKLLSQSSKKGLSETVAQTTKNVGNNVANFAKSHPVATGAGIVGATAAGTAAAINKKSSEYLKDIYKTAATLTSQQRNSMDKSQFGIPEQRRFPMPDKEHVLLAWRSVNKAKDIPDKEALKSRIKSRAKQLGVDTSTWK
jgi:hypothetical protein